MAIADRLVVMAAGRIADQGPPERVYLRPATLFAAEFMGETNRLPATRAEGGLDTPFGPLALDAPAQEGPLVLCLRPEAIRPAGQGGWALGPARLGDAAFFGTHYRVRATPDAAPSLDLVVHLPPGSPPVAGTRLALEADPAAITVFPAR